MSGIAYIFPFSLPHRINVVVVAITVLMSMRASVKDH